jgi:hypothetical protein
MASTSARDDVPGAKRSDARQRGAEADMDMDKGDRVIATVGIGGFLLAKVPKGTKGVITGTTGSAPVTYTMHFQNGETADCTESQMREPD